MFEGEFSQCSIGNGKGSSLRFRQQSENTQASGPQIERIKGCLGGGLRSPSSSILVYLLSSGYNCDSTSIRRPFDCF